VRLLGQTGNADEPGTPMKVVRAPTPPVLSKPDTRVPETSRTPMKAVRAPTPPVLPKPDTRVPETETSGPTKSARTGRVDELRAKLEERQSRVSATATGSEGGKDERAGARGPAGAEGGLVGALERMRNKIRPESCEVESVNWDE